MINEELLKKLNKKKCIYILPIREHDGKNLYAEDSIYFFKIAKNIGFDIEFYDKDPKCVALHDATWIIPVICCTAELLPAVVDIIKYCIKDKWGRNIKDKKCKLSIKNISKNTIKEIEYEGSVEGLDSIKEFDFVKNMRKP